jgi:hypothetical protein
LSRLPTSTPEISTNFEILPIPQVDCLVRRLYLGSLHLPHPLEREWSCGVAVYRGGEEYVVVLTQHDWQPPLPTRMETIATRVHGELLAGTDPSCIRWIIHRPKQKAYPAYFAQVALSYNCRFKRFESPTMQRIAKKDFLALIGIGQWPPMPRPLALRKI